MAAKFKFYNRINPITGNREYQTLMMDTIDGKDITYRTSFHNSREKARDEIARAQGEIRAAQTGDRVTVKQNYGSTRAALMPRSSVGDVLKTGGMITPSKEYEEIKQGRVYDKRTMKSQKGIRKSRTRSLLHANMLNPNYNRLKDIIDA